VAAADATNRRLVARCVLEGIGSAFLPHRDIGREQSRNRFSVRLGAIRVDAGATAALAPEGGRTSERAHSQG
jgi:hypothetical protein